MGRVHQLVGFNIYPFDLPFLFRRSWKHRVEVPFGIRRGRYWADEMVDLRDGWQLGDRQARGSLDSIAKHLGHVQCAQRTTLPLGQATQVKQAAHIRRHDHVRFRRKQIVQL